MYFNTKNYLKNIYNHTAKHTPRLVEEDAEGIVDDTIPPTMLFFFIQVYTYIHTHTHTHTHTYIYIYIYIYMNVKNLKNNN